MGILCTVAPSIHEIRPGITALLIDVISHCYRPIHEMKQNELLTASAIIPFITPILLLKVSRPESGVDGAPRSVVRGVLVSARASRILLVLIFE